MVTSVHGLKGACTASSTPYTGTGAGANCARAVSSNFMGYALTIGSLVILVLVLFSMLKRQRSVQWGRTMPTIPRQATREIGSFDRELP